MNEHTKVDPKSLANLGSIRVQVFRAKRRKIVPHHLAALPLVRDEISEKVFKGKSLKNNIKFVEIAQSKLTATNVLAQVHRQTRSQGTYD